MRPKHLMALLIASWLTNLGCSMVDSGSPWKDGNYELSWIDEPNKVTLSYRHNSTSSEPIIESQVFAVGSNANYIVVKQHPSGDKTKTHFFAIQRAQNTSQRLYEHSIIGPMTATEFAAKSNALNLPSFSKTLQSLE